MHLVLISISTNPVFHQGSTVLKATTFVGAKSGYFSITVYSSFEIPLICVTSFIGGTVKYNLFQAYFSIEAIFFNRLLLLLILKQVTMVHSLENAKTGIR